MKTVAAILGKRHNAKKKLVEYQVRWKGGKAASWHLRKELMADGHRESIRTWEWEQRQKAMTPQKKATAKATTSKSTSKPKATKKRSKSPAKRKPKSRSKSPAKRKPKSKSKSPARKRKARSSAQSPAPMRSKVAANFDDDADIDRVIAAHGEDGAAAPLIDHWTFAFFCALYAVALNTSVATSSADQDLAVGAAVAFLKCLPIWLLAHGASSPTVSFGLWASSAGDFALELSSREVGPLSGEQLFMAGLVSFFVAHVVYANGFSVDFDASAGWALNALFSLSAAGGIFATIYPGLPSDLVAPVAAYAVAIATMAFFAICKRGDACIGAVLFVASDAILALNRFVYGGALSGATLAIMVLYYAGQYFIARS